MLEEGVGRSTSSISADVVASVVVPVGIAGQHIAPGGWTMIAVAAEHLFVWAAVRHVWSSVCEEVNLGSWGCDGDLITKYVGVRSLDAGDSIVILHDGTSSPI